jgi:glutamyl-tRNA synthetase
MHVGGVRTALFAWLVARQNNGSFILRIEDTDKDREVEGSEQHIIQTLKTLGLDFDEGPDIGGPFGPYRQSERLDIYKEWGEKLLSLKRAYVDPYSEEEVEKFRDQAKAAKKPFLFRDYRPETNMEWDHAHPLRFLSDPKDYSWHDEIMGDLSAKADAVDDFILIKSDGYPTYNFAHIIDDLLMEMSHVIRGQEFLASVPKYLNLYEALDIPRPLLATVPAVLAPDGKRKLSKRDGAKDILEYISEGYLPETLINFMASLGWNDGSTQEIFSLEELVSKFKLTQVQHSGARFDDQRLIWMNGAHIRSMDLDELFNRTKDYWPEEAKNFDPEYLKKVLSAIKDRLKYLSEIKSLTMFFFIEPEVDDSLIRDNKVLKDLPKEQLKDLLIKTRDSLNQSDFSLEDITNRLNNLLKETNQKPVVLFSLIRIAITESPASPGLFETIEILGKEKVLSRLNKQIDA